MWAQRDTGGAGIGFINVRYRQLRGLVIHYRRRPMRFVKSDREWYGRSLINSRTVQDNQFGLDEDGMPIRKCVWCEMWRPVGRTRWCSDGCIAAYLLATGRQNDFVANHAGLEHRHKCSCAHCGRNPDQNRVQSMWDKDRWWTEYERFEVDHIVALSVAWARNDERARKRAYLTDNLQWLCGKCHSRKTGDDRRRLANLQAGRPEDWVKPHYINKIKQKVAKGQLALV